MTDLHRRQILQYAAGATAAIGSSAWTGSANAAACGLRAGDDFWFVNTYNVPCGRLTEAHRRSFAAHRMTQSGVWQVSSADALFAEAGDGRMTIFYVHGHRVDTQWATTGGWAIYRHLVQVCSTSPGPIRFVIWKWPSEKSALPLRDARMKAAISDHEGYKLGWFAAHIPATTPQSYVGFSLGPRVFTGALHLLAGGALCGQTLSGHQQPSVRAVLWAPALHNHWLAPGHAHGRAMYVTNAMLNLHNCCDPVLKRYHRLEPRTRPTALGYTGMPTSWLGPLANRYRQRNVCSEVGRPHLTANYYQSPSVMASTRQYLLWHNV